MSQPIGSLWEDLLSPPLLSSAPLLPDDSVGDDEAIMGIFDR